MTSRRRRARADRDYGIVFQSATLLDWRTVQKNVELQVRRLRMRLNIEHSAGPDLLDQLRFMADAGFTALEDNGMMQRTPEVQEQIAFGAGVHRCIGAPAATLEIQMFIEELAAWDKAFAVVDTPQRLHSNFMLGLTRLPVEVVKARDLAG